MNTQRFIFVEREQTGMQLLPVMGLPILPTGGSFMPVFLFIYGIVCNYGTVTES